MSVYHSVSELDFSLNDIPAMPAPKRVLMTSPEHFDVEYVINPHMAGHIGDIDKTAATQQWEALRDAYENLDFVVEIVDGLAGLPDMVFCANQTLPYLVLPSGNDVVSAPAGDPKNMNKGVVLSQMFARERKREVSRYARFFEDIGYESQPLCTNTSTSFEGMGDALWHPFRSLLWGGYGFRTDVAVYPLISEALGVRVLPLELTDPDFYHLDTCFSVLNEETVLIFPGAFQPDGLALIKKLFQNVLESPEDEARALFSCNAHCPDGKHVLIQSGCTSTNGLLLRAGFHPVELDTSEYLKAGGSVFCMKQMFW